MSLEYSLQSSLSEDEKSSVSAWIKRALDEISVESDDVFVQYIMVMINSGKTMNEISVELEAFLGNPECIDFVGKLGDMLKPLDTAPAAATAEKSTRIAKISDSSKGPSNKEAALSQPLSSDRSGRSSRTSADKSKALDTPLSSGRAQSGKAPQGRLIQNALKGTLQTQKPSGSKRRNDGGIEETPSGFVTNKKNRPNDGRPQQGGHAAPNASPGMPGMGMGMFDPSMMAQQMDQYAQMMGFDSSAAMMEFYNMSMMGMMQPGGPMGGQWAPPPPGAGRWHDGGGRFSRGRGPPRGGFRGGRFGAGRHGAGHEVPGDAIAQSLPQHSGTDGAPTGNESNIDQTSTAAEGSVGGAPSYSSYRGRGRGRNPYYDGGRGGFSGRSSVPYAPRGRGRGAANMTWTRESDMNSGLISER